MFDWLSKPYCPVDPSAKDWIERRLKWLSGQFPSNIFTDRPLVTPTEEFFLEGYEASKEAATVLFARICRLMGVSEDHVRLKFEKEDPNPILSWDGTRYPLLLVNNKGDYVPMQPAGTYSSSWRKHVITLTTNQIYDPSELVPTMAHELAHARLRGERRIRPDRFDEELLTDLTACFLGFAIFMANSPRVWKSQFTKWPGTQFNKPEYMTPPMFGYVLGHLAWHQGKIKPSWKQYLGPQVIGDFKDAARYLFETEDSSFKPNCPAESNSRS
jgi:hypothetical protein